MWTLSGNESAADRLREAAARGALAHALLFTGSGDLAAAAEFAAAAFVCTAPGGKPCGACGDCRKVRRGIHPDVVSVRDEEHKNVAVEIIRSARADAYIRPNEAAGKVYVFPDCALLTEQDQNVLLKIVEEGPAYAAFIFCAENPASVLPTLRSRCVEVPLRPAAEADAETPEETLALCRSLAAGKRCGPAEVLIRMERAKASREDVLHMLDGAYRLCVGALAEKCGVPAKPEGDKTAAYLAKNLTKRQIVRTIELLQKYRQDCRYNVNSGQTLGALAAELEGIL